MRTRDLLDDEDATLVLSYGFEVMDAETLLDEAPPNLVRRIARDAHKIDHVTIWETSGDPDAWALTMPNTQELLSAWKEDWFEIFAHSPSDDDEDKVYLIVINKNTQQAWSNEFGWVPHDSESYELFTVEEARELNLPMEGIWFSPDGYLPEEFALQNRQILTTKD